MTRGSGKSEHSKLGNAGNKEEMKDRMTEGLRRMGVGEWRKPQENLLTFRRESRREMCALSSRPTTSVNARSSLLSFLFLSLVFRREIMDTLRMGK